MNPYETDRLLSEYLLFHYGSAQEVLPWAQGPHDALDYPVRCVSEGLNVQILPANARALDLGCAVGRSSFELTRHCGEVVGIDLSQRFIAAAQHLKLHGEHAYTIKEEGDLCTQTLARLPDGVRAERATFQVGDATDLSERLGDFDVLLAANLIDRLADPRKFLRQLPTLVRPGGQLIIASPYTWLPEFTDPAQWLGGYLHNDQPVRTLQTLQSELAAHFDLITTKELPFLIREHSRKFQWSVAQCSTWVRK